MVPVDSLAPNFKKERRGITQAGRMPPPNSSIKSLTPTPLEVAGGLRGQENGAPSTENEVSRMRKNVNVKNLFFYC